MSKEQSFWFEFNKEMFKDGRDRKSPHCMLELKIPKTILRI